MNRLSNLWLVVLAITMWATCALTVVHAQTGATGALRGTVTDQSGSSVPGAVVKIIDSDTGVEREVTTNSDGGYIFTLLAPGNYRLEYSAKGFKTATIPLVAVGITETPVVNEQMAVGAETEMVTVTAESVQAVQTDNPTLGALVSNKEITDLPLANRNYTQALSLSPGVVATVSNASTLGQGSQNLYVNGNFSEANNYQMDGVPINNYANGNAGVLNGYYGGIAIPSPDALEEFKIQTSQYDAGYGRNPGANVNVVTRSGTTKFHGALFEFVRNNSLNANDYFAKVAGKPRGELKQNQFGGTFGGPISASRKFFFFTSYQGTRQRNGVSSDGFSSTTLPAQLTNTRTAAALGAEFCNVKASPTAAPGTGLFGGTAVACDGSNINPVALAILNAKLPNGQLYIPTPQTVTGGVGFSTFIIPAKYLEDQYMFNTDWALSSKNTLTEKFLLAFNPTLSNFSAGGLPGGGRRISGGSTNGLIKLTTLLTNNLVNEVRVSYLYARAGVVTTEPLTDAQVGITPASAVFPLLPTISVAGMGGTGGQDTDGAKQPSTTMGYGDDLSWVHKGHTVRMGVWGDHIYWSQNVYGLNRGALSFQSFNDFLLGLPGTPVAQGGNGSGISNVFSISGGASGPKGAFNLLRATDLAAYVQDDYKVSSKLTVNLGLRWEYDGQIWDTLGVVPDLWPALAATVPIPLTPTYAGFTVPPNYTSNPLNFPLPAGVFVRSTYSGTSNGAPKDNFGPRVGLAWQPLGDRFVIRSGYGWFYQRISGDFQLFPLNFSPPNTAQFARSSAANIASSFANPFNPLPPAGWGGFARSVNPVTGAPTAISIYSVAPNEATPLVQQWNLDVQYALSHSWVIDVAYVGARSEHLNLMTRTDLPQLASPTNPLNCGLPTGCVTTNTVANVSLRMPIVGFAPTGFNYLATIGSSNYNALQMAVKKRLSHGLDFQAAYTWSKALGDFGDSGGNYGGTMLSGYPSDARQQYGPLAINRPQRLILTYSWDIPGFSQGNALAKGVLSGWTLAGVSTIQSGAPVAITDSRGGSIYGFVGTSRGQLCPGMTNANILTRGGSIQSRLNDYLNPAAFCAPLADPNGTVASGQVPTDFGDLGVNVVRGPDQNNSDISLAKRFNVPIREGAYLNFRADFYNAFNHPQFAGPSASVTSATFGKITSTTVEPRLIQFGLRLVF